VTASLLTIATRGLRFFPMLLLGVVLFCAGQLVNDFFFQAADQLVAIERSVGGGR
jgi:hypothetical protein